MKIIETVEAFEMLMTEEKYRLIFHGWDGSETEKNISLAAKEIEAGSSLEIWEYQEWSNHSGSRSYSDRNRCGSCTGAGCDEDDLYPGSPECLKVWVMDVTLGDRCIFEGRI